MAHNFAEVSMKSSIRVFSTLAIFPAFFAVAVIFAGCRAAGGGVGQRVVPEAKAEEQAALIDQVKQLEGEWMATDEKGQTVVGAVFKTTSGGSAVREELFPGGPHEMTNVYHMDGHELMMTHYCALGNQPRLRAQAGKPGTIAFKFDGITNMTDSHAKYMGELTLTIVDKDTLKEDWQSFTDGKADEHVHLDLKRKK